MHNLRWDCYGMGSMEKLISTIAGLLISFFSWIKSHLRTCQTSSCVIAQCQSWAGGVCQWAEGIFQRADEASSCSRAWLFLIYSTSLIVSVFLIKIIKSPPKQLPFILQRSWIDVTIITGVLDPRPAKRWKFHRFYYIWRNLPLMQSITAAIQISPRAQRAMAWSIFILLIRPLPSHCVTSKFILYRISLMENLP